ncbi:hypothetical protein LXL04_011411 [Taraxacum kok-saghyz]
MNININAPNVKNNNQFKIPIKDHGIALCITGGHVIIEDFDDIYSVNHSAEHELCEIKKSPRNGIFVIEFKSFRGKWDVPQKEPCGFAELVNKPPVANRDFFSAKIRPNRGLLFCESTSYHPRSLRDFDPQRNPRSANRSEAWTKAI